MYSSFVDMAIKYYDHWFRYLYYLWINSLFITFLFSSQLALMMNAFSIFAHNWRIKEELNDFPLTVQLSFSFKLSFPLVLVNFDPLALLKTLSQEDVTCVQKSLFANQSRGGYSSWNFFIQILPSLETIWGFVEKDLFPIILLVNFLLTSRTGTVLIFMPISFNK